jgi:putative hydrolase of the HAD superfamily
MEDARRERFHRLALLGGRTITDSEAEEHSQHYRALYLSLRRPVPGAPRLLARLHGRTAIGIVSNNEVAEQEDKLRHIGIAGSVDALVISGGVGIAKPDPRIFAIALDRLGVAPEDAVMVGDSWANDVRGARAAGIRPIWFNRFGRTAPEPLAVVELTSYAAPVAVERALSGPRRA